MKNLHKVLIGGLISLSLALTGVSVFALSNRSAREVDASRDTIISSQDFYYLVDDLTDLHDGDTVILKVKGENDTICDIGGNPGYMYTTSENVHSNHDETVTWFDNATATTLQIKTRVVNDVTQYAFLGTFWPNKRQGCKKAGYIAHDPTGRNSSYPGYPAFGGVGYFKEAFGVRIESQIDMDECWFTLNYNAESGMDIRNVKFTDLRIAFSRDRWSGYFIWNGWGNVNLYKKITYTSITNIVTSGLKTQYSQGEELDLSGLQFDVHGEDRQGNPITFTADYDLDDKGLFQYNKYVVGSKGTKTQTVSFMNHSCVIFDVTILDDNARLSKITAELFDYRGTYVLAYQNSDGEGYNAGVMYFKTAGYPAYQTAMNSSTRIDGSNITIDGNMMTPSDSLFELTYESNAYRIKHEFNNGQTRYLGYNTDEESMDFYETAGVETALEVIFDSGYAYIRSKTDTTLYINEYGDLNNYGRKLMLFKQELNNSELTQLDSFMDDFANLTSVCDPFGGEYYEFGITESSWTTLASAYSAYSLNVKVYLRNVTYTHDDPNREQGSIEDLIDRYDYIYTKYHSTYAWMTDFLGRNGVMQDLQPQSSIAPKILSIGGETTAIVIIVSISIAAISLLATVMVIKRRKHN